MSKSRDLYDRFVGSLRQGPLVKDDVFFFGTVTGLHPIAVQIDGDDAPVGATPVLMARDAQVGSRVLCQLHGRKLIVLNVVRDPMGTLPEIGNTEHLDNFMDTGTWQQSANVDTSTSRGYPVAQAGLLEVFRGNDRFVYQRYSVYNGLGTYSRTYYNGTWYSWQLDAYPVETYDLGGFNISNFLCTGQIVVERMANGKRKATYNVKLTRWSSSNLGTISQVNWTALGTLTPAGAQFSTVHSPNYISGWINDTGVVSGATFPITISMDHHNGSISIKGTYGHTTTINANDFITIYAVFLEA